MHSADFDSLIPHMKRAGFLATALAAVITSMFGWQLGENVLAKMSLAGLLALCTFIVGYSLVAAYHAWQRGMTGVSAAAVALFVVAVSVEFLSHTGFTAANRDATVQQASFKTTVATDKRKAVEDLERKLASQEADRNSWRPAMPLPEARSTVATTEARPLFQKTSGCKDIKGSQSRTMCEKYNSAVAAVEMWDKLAQQEILIGQTQDALAKARTVASLDEGGHSASGSQGLILASMATGTENPDSAAIFWSGVGISALLAVFAIAAGGLLNFIAFAFDGARKATTATQSAVADAKTVVIRERDELAAKLADMIQSAKGAAA